MSESDPVETKQLVEKLENILSKCPFKNIYQDTVCYKKLNILSLNIYYCGITRTYKAVCFL